jgi:RNA polymerase sigma factor (sigma-70 family)
MAIELEDLRRRLAANHEAILTVTSARLACLARARGLPPDAVEDAVQETLIIAWRALERLRAPEGFSFWVDEICRNICRRFAQRRARDNARLTLLDELASDGEDGIESQCGATELAAGDPAIELVESAARDERAALVDQALGLLPAETRELVELVYLHETPHAEVAARLGVTTGALDTRLSRARQRLYDEFNGPLRAEAAAAGLALDEARGEGWVETRLWCSRCGKNRLQGMFMQGEHADGGPNLHLRCPECARRFAQDTIHTMGLVSLAGLSSFRPAWKRAMEGLTAYLMQALQEGSRVCWCCGGVSSVAVQERPGDSAYPVYIQMRCARCGDQSDATGDFPSVDQLAYWSHPVTRRFVLERPRWTTTFGAPVERQGALVIPLTIQDVTSADHVTLLADRRTLRPVEIA